MQDRPEATDLLEAVEDFLRGQSNAAPDRWLRFQLLVAANTAASAPGSARSTAATRVSTPCVDVSSDASASSLPALRDTSTTCTPSAAICRQNSAPIPTEAPATTAQGPYLSANVVMPGTPFDV